MDRDRNAPRRPHHPFLRRQTHPDAQCRKRAPHKWGQSSHGRARGGPLAQHHRWPCPRRSCLASYVLRLRRRPEVARPVVRPVCGNAVCIDRPRRLRLAAVGVGNGNVDPGDRCPTVQFDAGHRRRTPGRVLGWDLPDPRRAGCEYIPDGHDAGGRRGVPHLPGPCV